MVTVTTEDGMEDETPIDPEGTRTLRFLKTLVTVLTVTMIAGVVAITALLVIRLQTPAPPGLPDQIALPAGTEARGFSRGDGWLAVITTDNRILIYGLDGATVLQEIEITTPDG